MPAIPPDSSKTPVLILIQILYGYVHVTVDENGENVARKTFKIFDIKDLDGWDDPVFDDGAVLKQEDLVLKVGDFGQAQDVKESKKLPVVVGSLGFQSPEVLKRESLTNALDIFSIGAILFRMLLGVTYKVPGEIPDGKTKPVQAYAKMSANARDLLQRTLEYEPNNRIKMPDLLAHLLDQWTFAPLAAEDNAADTDGDCQGEISKSLEEEAAETLDEERLARAIAADRTLKQKGNKDVTVCGGKKMNWVLSVQEGRHQYREHSLPLERIALQSE
ncbi:hypothetical protein BGZ90_009935 [Linnemannia elongata]|nr:hypothetical protein BGZ90_009935 [Linnemannia elongata]